MQKHEVLVTFKALKKACEKHNSWFLTKTLQIMEKAPGFQMFEDVKKIGFALLVILGLPIFDVHVVSSHKKTSLVPSIQMVHEIGDWSVVGLSVVGSGHLVQKPQLDHLKLIAQGAFLMLLLKV